MKTVKNQIKKVIFSIDIIVSCKMMKQSIPFQWLISVCLYFNIQKDGCILIYFIFLSISTHR